MAENPPPDIVEISVLLEKVTAQKFQEVINMLAELHLLQPKTKVQYAEIVLHIETDHLKYSKPAPPEPQIDMNDIKYYNDLQRKHSTPDTNNPKLDPTKAARKTHRDASSP